MYGVQAVIILYAVCLVLSILVYAGLGAFAPKIAVVARVLIAAGVGVLIAGLATAWVYWAAHELPPDAIIIEPAPTTDPEKKR